MVRRWFAAAGILLLVSLPLTSCGVPKEDYDAVMAERDSALAEVSELSSELEEKERQFSELQQVFDSLEPKLELEMLLAEYGNKQAWHWIEGTSLSGDIFSGWIKREFKPSVEKCLEEIDEPELRTLYEEALDWEDFPDTWNCDCEWYDYLVNELGEMIKEDIESLHQSLDVE